VQTSSAKPLSESIPNAVSRRFGAPAANRRARRTYRHTEKVFALRSRRRLKAEEKRPLLAAVGRYAKAINPTTGKRTLSLVTVEIFRVLLYVCDQGPHGWTVKSQRRIAKAAGCARSTAAKHISLLRDHGFLSWLNMLVRVRVPAADDLAGPGATRSRVFNAPNAYAFENPEQPPQPSKSEMRTPERKQDANLLEKSGKTEETADLAQALGTLFERASARWARAGPSST
jgi:hypothetical protein